MTNRDTSDYIKLDFEAAPNLGELDDRELYIFQQGVVNGAIEMADKLGVPDVRILAAPPRSPEDREKQIAEYEKMQAEFEKEYPNE